MRRVWSHVLNAIDAEGGCVLVSIVAVSGSAPREAGCRMIVTANGQVGTIGGGMLEWRALSDARALLANPAGGYRRQKAILGPDLGQCCGGALELVLEVFGGADRGHVDRLARAEAGGRLVTRLRLGARARRDIVDGEHNLAQPLTATGEGEWLEDFCDRRTPVTIFGAGHTGLALARVLAPLPFRVRLVDERAEALALAAKDVEAVWLKDPLRAIDNAAAGGFAVVMTHSHERDFAIVAAALRAGKFAHVGLIGSHTKRARFVRRLKAAGLGEGELARLCCPIGLAGIRSKQPEAIAVSVGADLMRRREGEVVHSARENCLLAAESA